MKSIFKINNYTWLMLLTAFLCGFIKKMLIILFIVLIHEMGHILCAVIYGFPIKSIIIYPFGGLTKVDKPLNTSLFKELVFAFSGIIMQIVLLLFFHDEKFIYYNLNIMLFNLLPIIPLDGSKIIFEILCFFKSYQKSMNILLIISLVSIIAYIGINYHYVLNNYLIISLFIFKTYEFYHYRKLFHKKFLIERIFYKFPYYKVDNNIHPSKYKKGYKYYYFNKNHIDDEKTFLENHYY